MTKKIFRSIFIVALAVLLACLILITGVLYEYFSGQMMKQLHIQADLAAQGVENGGTAYLEGLGSEDYRLTWITADGTVLFDSQADAAAMENHADREEFREAVETGTGEGERTSATLSEKTLYAAKLLKDGSVMRVSTSHYTMPTLFVGIIQPFVAIAVLAAVLAGILASRLSRRIVGPLNGIDLDRPLENDVYEEISPLLTRVERQQRQIASQLSELRRKRDEFSAVTDSMSEGLILLDDKGAILSMNRSAAHIFGTDERSVGSDILTVNRSAELRTLLEKAGGGMRGEAFIEVGGQEYQFDASPVVSGGAVCGTALLAFDVTEKHRAERLRREFTANVSHELKTPLQSIMGSAELLENGLVKREDEKRFYAHIRSEAARLVTLVDDIIRLSKLDEGARFPEERVNLLALSEEAAENLADAAAKKNVAVTVSGDAGTVTGVHQLIREIVWNLLDNAIKYNREGGKVDVTVSKENGAVLLTVADTGIGIPSEHQGRVFERFYRVDKSHSRVTGGTGLGLSIVKHAAQYHGAAVSLKSEPEQGTSVTVRFPKERTV